MQRRKIIHVVSSGAFSFTKQAKLLAEVLNGYAYTHPYSPKMGADVYILIANTDVIGQNLLPIMQSKKVIFYTVIEGDFPPNTFKQLVKKYNAIVITPSYYVKSLLEKHDIYVDAVIPHGIPYYPPEQIPDKPNDFLYIGEWQKRKIPPWGYEVLKNVADKLTLVSSANSPFIQQIRPKELYNSAKTYPAFRYKTATDNVILELYKTHKFYLNVSGNEGFGLTPLEAEALYTIPITPRLPTFKEILGNCPYYLDINENDYEIWNYGAIKIILYHYNPEELTKLALSSTYDTQRAMECAENSKKYYYKDIYKKFYEFID